MSNLGSGEGAQALEYAALKAELAGDTRGAVAARRELARRDPQSPTAGSTSRCFTGSAAAEPLRERRGTG